MSNCFSGVCGIVADPNKVSDKLIKARGAFGNGDKTVYLELKFTGRLLNLAEKLKKGSQLFITGELQCEEYKEKHYWSVFTNSANFISDRKSSKTQKSSGTPVPALSIDDESDADIPF